MPSLPVHKGGILHSTFPVTYNYFYETKIKWQFEQWAAGLTPCSLVDEHKYFRRPVRDQLLLPQEWTTLQFRAFTHHHSLPRHCLWPSATHYHYTYITAHLPAWLFLLDCLTLKMKAPQLFKMFWTTNPATHCHIHEDLSLHCRGTYCLHVYPVSSQHL